MRIPDRLRAVLAVALVCAAPASLLAAFPASLTISNDIVSSGMVYVGYSQGHYYPGGNTTAWIERSGANCYRFWANSSYYEPTDDLPPYGDGVTDLASFETRKAALRADPENTAYINWPVWNNLFENKVQTGRNKCTLNHAMRGLRSIGVHPEITIQRDGWTTTGTWPDRWEHWQCYYAMAYHLAKNFDVELYETYNEPDLGGGPEQADYVEWLKLACDAIRCAVNDVNARFDKQLVCQILAPTITHVIDSRGNYHLEADPDSDPRDDAKGWGEVALNALRTDYKGTNISYNLFDQFCSHRYNSTGPTFTNEQDVLDARMPLHTPGGIRIPAFYTEFNRHNTSTWYGLDPGISQDTPYVFTDTVDILCRAMAHGVTGMLIFKFDQTDDGANGPQRTGVHYVWNTSPYNIGGAQKGVDAVRLFARSFAGGQPVLGTAVSSSQPGLTVCASTDPAGSEYRVFVVNVSDTNAFDVTYNFPSLDVGENSVAMLEEVSDLRQGEVAQLIQVPLSRSVTIAMSPRAVHLLTLPRGQFTSSSLFAVADAQVQAGTSQDSNFGNDTVMRAKMGSTVDLTRASFLKFDLHQLATSSPLSHAVLQVYGRNAGDSQLLSFQVYGLVSDNWNESTITWANAQDLASSGPQVLNVGTDAFPIGTLTVTGSNAYSRIDVTPFVKKQLVTDGIVTFLLLRELRYPDDTADTGRHAYLQTRESTTPDYRPTLKVWSTSPVTPVKLSRMTAE